MFDRKRFEEEHPGASDECPSFFRACVRTASKPGGGGYNGAAYQLAGAAQHLVEGDLEESVLDEFLVITEAEVLLAWLDKSLPRCMALIPRRRRGSFTAGLERWLEEQQ